MSIQFLGMIGHRLSSEILPPSGPIFDKAYITRFAQAHEQAGFDRVLVGYWSDQPDGFLVAATAGLATDRLTFLLAHRPGFVAPTVAARKLATLEHLLDGRLAVHIISGGNDADQRKDGDTLGHDERYARTDEFIDLLKLSWAAEAPFDYHGKHYQVEQGFSSIKPLQRPHLPIYFGGASDAALSVAGKQADVFMLWGEPLAQAAQALEAVRAQARRHQREVEFSVSFRPIIAATEAQAWAKAEAILAKASDRQGQAAYPKAKPQSVGAQRLLHAVAQGDRLDSCLWTGIARLVGGGHNSTALVGTPEQVSDALLAYYDLGVRNILIRGFDPLNDAIEYGRELIPLTRAKVAAREQARTAVAV
ncbi:MULTISPECIES: LLM class flavin-dependent oxidoreductase [unclassified Pseudomonas]|uniref:LLM class flavin-dependent oxidoreductase n=1 Tax=unclassified Pseudomonas TaxID=196821 RepID=UPI000BD00659|nr:MULTISPECIES: LLM class flavin-dependent oxidoreductase [unclassified Pseudomonas]PVZ16493.1 alkanesulfonate monooxygenase [Pseudomonas sp. URIL14HWK12:I12]PVZ25651.1 alkanesulfonate monooxygenase [Pseudomonas sp. URIL14HWK12:I10]PVZ36825.1 alkanesulfonate monooxygenase [Pseudomonas sp. URIL14HWK12:I11]SNZ12538.1 alkanesulfonate monooxygenase [Pseudomonas sp. URIL14HWK12:I9]